MEAVLKKESRDVNPARILVVEDELIVAENLREILNGFGYITEQPAADSTEAIAAVEAFAPDLILMDIVLEGSELDGIETAREIRSRWDIPIIFVTAFSDDETLQRVQKIEPLAYILKPFNERELNAAIGLALNKHHTEIIEQKRSAILVATSFAMEWFVRYLRESRRAGQSPEILWREGVTDVLDHLRGAVHALSVIVYQIETGANGAMVAHIRYVSRDPDRLKHSSTSVSSESKGTLSFSESIWRFILAKGNAVASEIEILSEPDRQYFKEQGITSIAFLPIIRSQGLWGFICYADTDTREWSDSEIEALMMAGNIIGAMVD